MRSLSEVLAYRHDGVVEKLRTRLSIGTDEAEILFDDTKRFLFLCGSCDEPLGPPPAIDTGWHEFILFTKDYDGFCSDKFGRFIHHQPYRASEQVRVDGSRLARTLELAEGIFGGLSVNWKPGQSKCNAPDPEDCAPEPPSPPSDCESIRGVAI